MFMKKTKVRLFNSLVKAVVVHGCETWQMTEGDKKKLDVFRNKCLRRIFQDLLTIRNIKCRFIKEKPTKKVE